EALTVELEAAFDENFFHEGVAHLDTWAFLGHPLLESFGCQDRRATDAVASRSCPEEDDEVADALGVSERDVLVSHDAHAQRIDEGVALVGGVEVDFAADVGQAQAVAVAADSGDDALDDARRVLVVGCAETQL